VEVKEETQYSPFSAVVVVTAVAAVTFTIEQIIFSSLTISYFIQWFPVLR
jgi:hypothetical protein